MSEKAAKTCNDSTDHECGIECPHKVCVCVKCGASFPNGENDPAPREATNYKALSAKLLPPTIVHGPLPENIPASPGVTRPFTQEEVELLTKPREATEEAPQPTCKARTANTGANDPQDCNWPFCGCDPAADKVIEAIQESGFTLIKDEDLLQLTKRAESAPPPATESQSSVQQWNGTVQPNGTVYDDKTLIQLLRADVAKAHAEFELMRKRAYDAGLDTSLNQREVQELAQIKMGGYPVYLTEPATAELRSQPGPDSLLSKDWHFFKSLADKVEDGEVSIDDLCKESAAPLPGPEKPEPTLSALRAALEFINMKFSCGPEDNCGECDLEVRPLREQIEKALAESPTGQPQLVALNKIHQFAVRMWEDGKDDATTLKSHLESIVSISAEAISGAVAQTATPPEEK
jgi:hypothetical protein